MGGNYMFMDWKTQVVYSPPNWSIGSTQSQTNSQQDFFKKVIWFKNVFGNANITE